MERYVYLCFILCILCASTLSSFPDVGKKYRTDYEYNTKTNAFYKLHIESASSWLAAEICGLEGGELMVPGSNGDIAQVHGMLKRFPDLGSYVFVGSDRMEHDVALEQPIFNLEVEPTTGYSGLLSPNEECDVVDRRGEILSHSCYSALPFVCKVGAKDAPYDELCGVYGLGYQYFSSIGSCYRVPPVAYTWDAAYGECLAEGAHLVVLNSKAEHEAVWDVVRTTSTVRFARADFFFFAGIRANRPADGSARVFRTVFNETLDEAGYNVWAEGEPNNHLDTEYCGSIFKNDGNYNDLQCSHLFAFICEKEVHT